MKKLILLIFLPVFFSSCSMPFFLPEQVATNFAEGLETQDIELLMSAYQSEADFIFISPDGPEDKIVGKDAIRSAQLEGFKSWENLPEVSINDWIESDGESVVTYYLIVKFGDMELLNTLELTSDFFSWGILHQTVEFN